MDGLDIDALAQSLSGTPMEDNDIMVVGVGGAGCNMANHLFQQGIEYASVVICSHRADVLEYSPVPNKVEISYEMYPGRWLEMSSKLAESETDKIEDIFNNTNARLVFIISGMGKGFGTGASAIVARAAKKKGLLTIGVVTIPFLFEGRKRIGSALHGIDEMMKHVDSMFVINNDSLHDIYSDIDFYNCFAKSDESVTNVVRMITEIIATDGYTHMDFNDLDATLRNGGIAIITSGEGEGEHRVLRALQNALNSPQLKNRDINGSRNLLINLYMSRKDDCFSLEMHEVQELREFVLSIDDEVDVIWGVAIDDSLGEKVRVTLLATGFDEKNLREIKLT